MSLQRHHLAVVGAGSAGLASAVLAAEIGARVVLIERHRLGGDRFSYRVPATALIQAARSGRDEAVEMDLAAALDRARQLRTASAGIESLRDLGIDVVFGAARFVAADAVEVDGRRLEFQRAVIATGARTAVPRIKGLDDVDFRTPETLFELTSPPRRFGVLGGGSRGCEIAQTFARLGCEVHLFVAGDRLLTGRDPDAAAIVEQAMRRDGVKIHLSSMELELRPGPEVVTVVLPIGAMPSGALPSGATEVEVDELLLATGPMPNVERLGLEAAGVEYDLSGIEVDRNLRTTNRRIFAVGGVVTPERGDWRIVSPGQAPDADARMAVRNALLFRRLERRRRTVPRVTYTRPEIARVGIGVAKAVDSPKIETLTVPLADADRGGLFGGEGFLRIHLKRRSGEILGGTVVADQAAELIGPLAIAVNQRMHLGAFAEIPLPHPTRGEIYRRAAFTWRRQVAGRRRLSVTHLIGLWLRLTSRL